MPTGAVAPCRQAHQRPAVSHARAAASPASALHRLEEFTVRLGVLHLVEQEFDRRQLVHGVQELAQDPHLGELALVGDELFLAGAGTVDVDRGEHPLLGDAAVEVDLAVAGALELLVDDIVHLRAGVDQRGGENGETAALLDVARRAEEALRALQCVGVDAAGEHLAGGWHHGVVGAGEPGDRIEQDHYILLVLDQALGLLDDHFGDLHVTRRRLIEGAGNHLALHRALHLGDFLGPLVDEQHDQIDLGMIGGDGSGDVLQQHRLAGLGRGDDQAALALADGGHQVDGAGGEILGRAVAAFEFQALGRMERRQVLEQHLVARALGRVEVDLTHLEQREIALAILRRPDQPRDRVAGTQIEAPDLTRAHIDVIGTREIRAIRRAEEAETVLQDLEHAVAVDVLAVPGVRLEDRENDVLLARAGQVLEPHGLGHLHQLVDGLGLELREIHGAARLRQLGGTDDLGVVGVEHLGLVHHLIGTATTVAAVAVTVAVARTLVGPVAALIAEVASHRLLSRNAESWDLETAPTFCASTVPFLNRISVGMPRIPNFGGVCGFSSMLILATLIRPWYSLAISSRIGAIILQGPHHSAQKSSSTGCSDLRTSCANVASVVCTMCELLTRFNLRQMQSVKKSVGNASESAAGSARKAAQKRCQTLPVNGYTNNS